MKRTAIEKAYAKINLFLEVTGKRADGYHTLDTVMQTVSLCDTLALEYDDGGEGVTLSCDKKYVPTDGGNVAVRCADEFMRYTGRRGGVRIALEKHIPVAAGMGGGSADGAAVLRALNRLAGTRLSEKELCAIGAKIGADVPFLVCGGCMRAGGIGEELRKVALKKRMYFALAIGSRGSQTPAAYRALDERAYTGVRSADELCRALEAGDVSAVPRELYNAFESVVCERLPEVGALRERILEEGAAGALMSGSGASVFGVFGDAAGAKAAVDALRKEGYFAASAYSVL